MAGALVFSLMDLGEPIAHHIAVINIQAGVSAHMIRDRPDAAAEALGHVRGAAQRVLDELGTMLAVLRGTGDETEPVGPAPGLEDLDRLVDSSATAGLEVGLAREGTPRSLPAVAGLAAYRIVQESLTNARKYGRGRGGRHADVRTGRAPHRGAQRERRRRGVRRIRGRLWRDRARPDRDAGTGGGHRWHTVGRAGGGR